MNINNVINLASKAGQIILESGGETYRVEETIIRICNAYGLVSAESFVTPTVIMISATDINGRIISHVKRIKTRTVDLEKISRVNDLSRNICPSNLSVDFVNEELRKISETPRYGIKTTLFFSAVGASFFTLLFGGDLNDFIVSFFIGIIIKWLSILLNNININEFFTNALGGAIAAILALVSVELHLATNVDKIIIGSIMLLVPGLAITNAIRDTIAGDLIAGVSRGIEAFLIAIAIAVGSGIILKIWFDYFGILIGGIL
ncbi:threonine/serine exporter family protein [Clostridium sp. SYSU_GA19001]|uniref:threonine/serine exporter family protein n=1 Tax=Clostridium caldaquaticum TaxID=2940653 RepID=UPI0020778D1D|nr:threonine/serine exporter family protein [Clostridium caldaquaticum]MCM8710451.1 threonine/serine exporter family protein [Clostridium caldaquaticum]